MTNEMCDIVYGLPSNQVFLNSKQNNDNYQQHALEGKQKD